MCSGFVVADFLFFSNCDLLFLLLLGGVVFVCEEDGGCIIFDLNGCALVVLAAAAVAVALGVAVFEAIDADEPLLLLLLLLLVVALPLGVGFLT